VPWNRTRPPTGATAVTAVGPRAAAAAAADRAGVPTARQSRRQLPKAVTDPPAVIISATRAGGPVVEKGRMAAEMLANQGGVARFSFDDVVKGLSSEGTATGPVPSRGARPVSRKDGP